MHYIFVQCHKETLFYTSQLISFSFFSMWQQGAVISSEDRALSKHIKSHGLPAGPQLLQSIVVFGQSAGKSQRCCLVSCLHFLMAFMLTRPPAKNAKQFYVLLFADAYSTDWYFSEQPVCKILYCTLFLYLSIILACLYFYWVLLNMITCTPT